MSLRWSDRTLLAGVLIATTLALLPKLANGFVYDDIFVFLASDVVHDIGNVPAFFTHNTMYAADRVDPLAVDTYRPLTLTTFALDSVWTGKNPIGYHLVNLLIHLVCVALVFFLAKRVLSERNAGYAWVAAAWFGLSPWIGEAHIWINGRSDPLCALFALSAILAFDQGVRSERFVFSALASFLLFASLLSKEVALGILPALLILPVFERTRTPWKARAAHLGGPMLAGALYLLVRTSVLGGLGANAGRAGLIDSVSNFGLLFFESLRALLVPSPPYIRCLAESYLAIDPLARWVATGAAWTIVLGAFLMRRRQPALAWSTVFFACTLAPAVAVTVLVWPGFGRYLYLPFAGLCIGLVDALADALRRVGAFDSGRAKRATGVLVGVYLFAQAALLTGFTHDFHDDGALYGAAIEHAPSHAYGYAHAGIALINIGKADEAIEYLEKAYRIQPNEPKYRTAFAQALIRTDRKRDAIALAESWLRDGRPQDAPEYLLVIVDAAEAAEPERARAAAQACVRAYPDYGTCRAALRRLEANDIKKDD